LTGCRSEIERSCEHRRDRRSAKRDLMMATEDLDERIAELQTLRREKLLADWEALWKRKPPKNISRILLIRSIAYKLQERIYAGLSPSCRKALDRLIRSTQSTRTSSKHRNGQRRNLH